jgi:hypothetical protein
LACSAANNRKELQYALNHLEKAKAAFTELHGFLSANGRLGNLCCKPPIAARFCALLDYCSGPSWESWVLLTLFPSRAWFSAALMLDKNGEYKKKAPQEEMEARLGVLKSMCLSREEADQSALQAQDIVIEVCAACDMQFVFCSMWLSMCTAGVNTAQLMAAMGAPDPGLNVPHQVGRGDAVFDRI